MSLVTLDTVLAKYTIPLHSQQKKVPDIKSLIEMFWFVCETGHLPYDAMKPI